MILGFLVLFVISGCIVNKTFAKIIALLMPMFEVGNASILQFLTPKRPM